MNTKNQKKPAANGSAEAAERRQQSRAGPWRLDVRGMLLSKLYHSVTQQDQSPQTAVQLFFCCTPAVSWCSLFILTLQLRYCDHTSRLVRYWTGNTHCGYPASSWPFRTYSFFVAKSIFRSIVYFPAESGRIAKYLLIKFLLSCQCVRYKTEQTQV